MTRDQSAMTSGGSETMTALTRSMLNASEHVALACDDDGRILFLNTMAIGLFCGIGGRNPEHLREFPESLGLIEILSAAQDADGGMPLITELHWEGRVCRVIVSRARDLDTKVWRFWIQRSFEANFRAAWNRERERFQELIDGFVRPTLVLDEDNHLVRWNRAAEPTLTAALGAQIEIEVGADLNGRLSKRFAASVADLQHAEVVDWPEHGQVRLIPLPDGRGDPRWLGVVFEPEPTVVAVSDAHAVEDDRSQDADSQPAESVVEERSELDVEAVPDAQTMAASQQAMAVIDRDGVVIDANEAWLRRWRLGAAQVLASNLADFAVGLRTGTSEVGEVLAALLPGDRLPLITVDNGLPIIVRPVVGHHVYVCETEAPGDGSLMAMGDREMTALRHESRTPLAVIQAALEVIRDRPQQVPGADSKILLDDAVSACHHLADLLGTDASIETDMVLAIEQAVRLLVRAVPSALDWVTTEIDGGSARVLMRPLHCRQILLNLLDNARRAVADVARPAISIALSQSDEGIDVVVSDNGVGMSAEQTAACLQPFVGSATGGSGLGLTIVHSLVTRYGGSMTVHSIVGRGTTFTLRFPSQERTWTSKVSPTPSKR